MMRRVSWLFVAALAVVATGCGTSSALVDGADRNDVLSEKTAVYSGAALDPELPPTRIESTEYTCDFCATACARADRLSRAAAICEECGGVAGDPDSPTACIEIVQP